MADERPDAIELDAILDRLREGGPASAAGLAAAVLGRDASDDDRRTVNALLYRHPELARRDDDTGLWSALDTRVRRRTHEPEAIDSTVQVPLETFADLGALRDDLIRSLELDLLGPAEPNEMLDERPSARYLVGILEPAGAAIPDDALERTDIEVDSDLGADAEAAPAVAEDEAGADDPLPSTDAMSQSSIGLTFAVAESCPGLVVKVEYGTYGREAVAGEERWVRTPHVAEIAVDLGAPEPASPLPAGAELRLIARPATGGTRTVTIFLVNRTVARGERPEDDECLFQPTINIRCEGNPAIVHRPPRWAATDPDSQSNGLLYRLIPEFASGHGCAVGWRTGDGGRAEEVWTTVLPAHERPAVSNAIPAVPAVSMASLGSGASPDALAAVRAIPAAYEAWILERETEETAILSPEHAETARIHLDLCRTAAGRIRGGIDVLEVDEQARRAFHLANDAMRDQRLRSQQARVMRRTGERPDVGTFDEPTWRPFQLAFILLNIAGIASDESPDRRLVDLLWFPTGGGKTEAYLGLAAFAIFLRRLRGAGSPHGGSGVTVLMRYTLRLLTVQQFQRAAALACAAEVLRRARPGELGTDRITIGLWVGQKSAPNNFSDAKDRLQELADGRRIRDSNPYQISSCPWCGESIGLSGYTAVDETRRMLVHCPNPTCAFHGGGDDEATALPITVIDEEIYATCPSIVIGTVDKFARLPWNPDTMTLFGRVDRHCRRHGFIRIGAQHASHRAVGRFPPIEPIAIGRLDPPDLIIQDELHLITGPLGTLAGLYETAIDYLSARITASGPIGPKVIASTATIRHADDQVRSLFARPVNRFPPAGLDAGHSFFATDVVDGSRRGSVYLGVYAPGRSGKTSLIRIYARLMQRAEELWRAAPESGADGLLDSFWTVVGYFNSLRELGGAVRLVDDDIPARIGVLANRNLAMPRLITTSQELTSRIPPERVPEILDELERPLSSGSPIDVLLATNMIQVGVDIDRLGLMVVTGQPKTSAEYIQATSRVGRSTPGLVITLYNWTRPRDISHYEHFETYHAAMYRHVEGATLTPFAPRARDRALAGVYIAMNRLARDGWAENQAAGAFDRNDAIALGIRDHLVARAHRLDRSQESAVEAEVTRIAESWQRLAEMRGRHLSYAPARRRAPGDAATLMVPADQPDPPDESYRVSGSLRDVETEVDLRLVSRGDR